MNMPSSPLFSRLLTIVGVLAVLGLAYWFITTSLTPYPVPPPPPRRTSVTFDPKVDISKNQTFNELRPLSQLEVKPSQMGRANPFAPPEVEVLAPNTTSTEPELGVPVTSSTEMDIVPTSTSPVSASSTGPADLIPPSP